MKKIILNEKQKLNNKGMVIYLVLIVGSFLFLLMYNLSMLSHGELNQLNRTETMIKCEIATRSIYQEIINDFRVSLWENRKFKNEPYSIVDGDKFGAKYNAVVEDTPGIPRSADIWISSQIGQVKRVVFYRVNVSYSVFQKMNQVESTFFSYFNSDEYGENGKFKSLQNKVEEIIQKRKSKIGNRDHYSNKIQHLMNFNQIMTELGVPVAGETLNIQTPFSANSTVGYASNPMTSLIAKLEKENGLSEGKMSVDDFNTVQKMNLSTLNDDFISQLKNKFGDRKAVSIAGKIDEINTGNFISNEILNNSIDSDDIINEDFIDNIIGDDSEIEISENTDDDGDSSDVTNVVGNNIGTDDTVNNLINNNNNNSLTDDNDVADNPVDLPVAPENKVYTFNDLKDNRDLYDEKYEKKLNKMGSIMGSIFAYSNQSIMRKTFKWKLRSGTATINDYKKYIMANNTYSKYTLSKKKNNSSKSIKGANDRAERKRDDITDKAEEYFSSSTNNGGVPVDSEGNPKI